MLTPEQNARIHQWMGTWYPGKVCGGEVDWDLCLKCGDFPITLNTHEGEIPMPELTDADAMAALRKGGYSMLSELHRYWMKLPQYQDPRDAIFAAVLNSFKEKE